MRVLGGVAVVLLWLAALVALAVLDGWAYAIGGTALTIAVGALLDTPRVLPVPLVLAAAVIVPVALSDDEGFGWHDDTYGGVIPAVLIFFVVPATVALGAGLALRRVARRQTGPPAP